MATPFEFNLKLTQSFASALSPVNAGLAENQRQMAKSKKGVELLEVSFGSFSKTLERGGPLLTVDLISAGRLAFDTFKSVVGVLSDVGREIIRVAAQTQDLNLAVELNVGKERAGAIQDLADALAGQTRFDDDVFKKQFLPFLRAGVRDTELLDSIATAAVDAAALLGGGQDKLEQTFGALESLAVKRKASRGLLEALSFNEADFYAELAKSQGISTERAKKLAEEGKFKSDQLLSFALGQIAKRQGGQLGEAARRSRQTLGGTLDVLANLQENFLKRIATSPGVVELQGVLDNFIKVVSGPTGADLASVVGDAFHGIVRGFFGDLTGPDGAAKLELQVAAIRDSFRTWIPVLETAAKLLRGIVDAVLAIPNFLSNLESFSATLTGSRSSFAPKPQKAEGQGFFGTIEAFSTNLLNGVALDDGLAAGLRQGAPKVAEAAVEIASLPGDVTRDVNQINSPSELFRGYGRANAAGLALGLDDGAPDVATSARRLLGDDVGAGTGSGRSITIGAITVEVVVAAGKEGAEQGQVIGQAVRVEIVRMLDEIGATL